MNVDRHAVLLDLGPEEVLEFAKFAQQTSRFEDMRLAMLRYVSIIDRCLTRPERTMLAQAYQETTNSLRHGLHQMKDLGHTTSDHPYMRYLGSLLESNIDELCNHGRTKLMPQAEKEGECEMLTYYNKMAGDYYRYLCEWDINIETAIKKANMFYTRAMEHGEKLDISHPTRLGACLNFGVFTKEILNDKAKAIEMMQPVYEKCYKLLETCDDETFKKSSVILGLMQDNYTLWEAEE